MCIVTSPACSVSTSTKRLMWVPFADGRKLHGEAELADGLLLRVLPVEHDERIADAR